MSILIKGIDMPKAGEKHRITIYDNGEAYITTSNRLYETDRKDVEVIEIPTPHGRLIDWDAFNNKLDIQYAEGRGKALAPTILEEEK